ncbi:tautomerase family protein [Chryseobacterium sp. BIGb0232]|uniref:tautomerase family protein n=1 Tax=Chryseobacterium sp. BIGb0232 TaxID=2940598 RepID=UPI000F4AADE4|nr:tautomerase family protein [Chryseobacterium sp. BIGb0232]MCS4300766.1 phenylpyruvate tautomerase PptA (4-oxalocrotonate tautomerase family) [Chryseobacterium sp. BIGb0232]ROS20354.1 tautomerase-like protein [Chryseobacterium nakagawai]
MPLIRITLSENYSAEECHKISQAVHATLIEDFTIPADDYFHIIEQVNPSQLFFPDQYLGMKHDQGILFIQIIAAMGRTREQKQKLYKNIVLGISGSTNINPQNIIITLLENSKENWSFGNGELQNFNHI